MADIQNNPAQVKTDNIPSGDLVSVQYDGISDVYIVNAHSQEYKFKKGETKSVKKEYLDELLQHNDDYHTLTIKEVK